MTETMAKQGQFTHDQHIVPQWHLRRFTDSDGVLWCYKRNKPVKKTCPKGECFGYDFYEYDVKGRRTNNEYDGWLGAIENDAAKIVDNVQNGSHLTQRDRLAWSFYVASLFRRTAKYRDQISAPIVEKFAQQPQDLDYIRERQYELLKRGERVPFEDLKKETESMRDCVCGSDSFYHLSGIRRQTPLLAGALMTKSWRVFESPSGQSFVMSDSPVSTFEFIDGRMQAGAGFGKPWTTVILPLTQDRLFVASSPFPWISVDRPGSVDFINVLTVRFAYKNVYAHVNSPEIQSLVDSEINRVVFGRNAFVTRFKVMAL
jgi:Protein of unknown function (DUF4238)